MRTIIVDNKEYKWRVGRKNIEIRGDDNFKLIIPRPKPQKRWGVIKFNYDFHYNKGYAIIDQNLLTNSELVSLPDKIVTVTPQFIRDEIFARMQINE